MTVFWLRGPLSEFNHHLVATGKEIDRYLPTSLQNNPELQTRALVVKKLRIVPVECIARGYLTGSGWSSYQNDGTVCGIKLPAGLCNDSQLPEPIFTPTTKAESGHDLSLDARRVTDEHGPHLKVLTLAIYSTANKYARSRGIIIADFKLEFGDNGILGDEVVTPDSSRFWHEDEWKIALKEGRIPTSQDKEFVRTWGKRVKTPFKKNGAKIVGINNLDPENPDHLKFVHSLTVPKEVLTETAVRYREIFQQLVRVTIRDFQLRNLGIIG